MIRTVAPRRPIRAGASREGVAGRPAVSCGNDDALAAKPHGGDERRYAARQQTGAGVCGEVLTKGG